MLFFTGDEFIKDLTDVSVREGTKATFECIISRDDGVVSWCAGDTLIEKSVNIEQIVRARVRC